MSKSFTNSENSIAWHIGEVVLDGYSIALVLAICTLADLLHHASFANHALLSANPFK